MFKVHLELLLLPGPQIAVRPKGHLFTTLVSIAMGDCAFARGEELHKDIAKDSMEES
jgi:hypothetical protein